MAADNTAPQKPSQRILFAQTCCLCFGLGLLLWGVAPALVARLISGQPPEAAALAMNGLMFVIAFIYITFHTLLRQRILWAAWSAFIISCLFMGSAAAVFAVTGFMMASTFILLLSGVTSFATWLAIDAISEVSQLEALDITKNPQ